MGIHVARVSSKGALVVIFAGDPIARKARIAGAGKRARDVGAGGIRVTVICVCRALVNVHAGGSQVPRAAGEAGFAGLTVRPLGVPLAVLALALFVAAGGKLVAGAADAFKGASRGILEVAAGGEAGRVIEILVV